MEGRISNEPMVQALEGDTDNSQLINASYEALSNYRKHVSFV